MDKPRDRLSVEELMLLIKRQPGSVTYAMACDECDSTDLTYPPICWAPVTVEPYGVSEQGVLMETHLCTLRLPESPTCNRCGHVGASLKRQEG